MRWIIGFAMCIAILSAFPARAFDRLSCENDCLSLSDTGPRDACKKACRATEAKEASCKRGRTCGACLESVNDRATVEECEGAKIYYGDCFCRKPDGSSYNYDSIPTWSIKACTVNCKAVGGSVDETQGIGKIAPVVSAVGATSVSEVNALCFTQDQCSAPGYDGSVDRFVPGQGCPQGQGNCLAPEPKLDLSSPILGQTSVTGIRSYILLGFRYLLNIVLVVTVIMFIYAGLKYIFGSSFADIQSAKDTMMNATIGLLLTFGAVLLLRTVNPATTRFDTLRIYLINKQEFTLATWCNVLQPQGGKERKFADAGKPPGSIPFSADPTKFTVGGQETKCGQTYYVQGTTGQTCGGLSCAETKGTACLTCVNTKMSSECERVPPGTNACVKTIFGGTIEWKHAKWPQYLWLLPVCKGIQPPENFAKIDDNVKNRIVATLTKTAEAESGTGSYSFAFSDAHLSDWEAQCEGKGLLGVLLAGLYKDAMSKERAAENLKNIKSFYKGLKAGAVAGGTSGAVGGAVVGPTGSIGGAVVGAITGGISGGIATQYSPDDIFVAARFNCLPKNVGKLMYAGYADGAFGRDLPDIKTAIYCGWSVKPFDSSIRAEYLTKHDTGVFDVWGDEDRQAYWTVEELKAAINGSKPISCSLVLNAVLAPTDPGTNVMGCCKSTSLYKDAKPNVLWCPE